MVSATQAVGLGLILLFVAFAFPVMVDATNDNTIERTVILDGIGSTETVGDALRVTVQNKTDTQANLSVSATETGNNTELLLNQSETKEIQLDGNTVTLTAVDIAQGDEGEITVDSVYPKKMGWDTPSIEISDNLSLVFVVVAFVIIAGMIAVVFKG